MLSTSPCDCCLLLLTCGGLVTTLLALLLLSLLYRLKRVGHEVCIVVLGDVGRSPRMQYHATSFLKHNFTVNIVGYPGSPPLNSLQHDPRCTFTYLTAPPSKPSWLPGVVFYVFKAGYQWLQLFAVLMWCTKPSHFFVQNPPAIPTLSVTWLVSRVKGTAYVIDWHNYAYTILALNIPNKKHPLVRFSEWYEGVFGALADCNLCVTEAMRCDLECKWGITASVLYDRPPEHFRATTVEEKHQLFSRLANEYEIFAGPKTTDDTVFTTCEQGVIKYKEDMPALIVSSTSWTEDEDFSILLEALELYDEEKKLNPSSHLPNIVCAITGKGPQKSYYEGVLRTKVFSSVRVVTPWLASGDYPKLIGSSDLGVCLHTSSSGLDLPMKVVDMFGCGLPVCAVGFPCLDELVKHDVNGMVFGTPRELANQMRELLLGFPGEGAAAAGKLRTFRENLRGFQGSRWHENWTVNVLPLIS